MVGWELLVYVGAGVGTAALLWFFRQFWKLTHEFTIFSRDWEGEPARAGVDARPGVMARLNYQDKVLANQDKVLAELQEDLSDLKAKRNEGH